MQPLHVSFIRLYRDGMGHLVIGDKREDGVWLDNVSLPADGVGVAVMVTKDGGVVYADHKTIAVMNVTQQTGMPKR